MAPIHPTTGTSTDRDTGKAQNPIPPHDKKLETASEPGDQIRPNHRTLLHTKTGQNEFQHLEITIRIHGQNTRALVDSGAQGNYMSPRTVNKQKISWKEKEQPYRLSTVEGESVSYGQGIVNMETDHLHTTVNDHPEQITFDITDIAEHEVILGIPWLRRSNPRIDWTTGQLWWDKATPAQGTTEEGN